jgi:hypothetical protein
MAYFAPGTAPYLLDDASVPVILVEGEKKTLCLSALAWLDEIETTEGPRWLAVGLGGVWSWHGVVGKTNDQNGERRDVKGVISDLKRLRWRGRRVVVLFDTNVRTQPLVSIARWQPTEWLNQQGAQVFWFHWPRHTPAGINGIDDYCGQLGAEKTLEAIEKYTVKAPVKLDDAPREFSQVEDGYSLAVPSMGVVFQVDKLRRERNDLLGLLTVKCELPGTKTLREGILSEAEFNFLSERVRKDKAKHLAERARAKRPGFGKVCSTNCATKWFRPSGAASPPKICASSRGRSTDRRAARSGH